MRRRARRDRSDFHALITKLDAMTLEELRLAGDEPAFSVAALTHIARAWAFSEAALLAHLMRW